VGITFCPTVRPIKPNKAMETNKRRDIMMRREEEEEENRKDEEIN